MNEGKRTVQAAAYVSFRPSSGRENHCGQSASIAASTIRDAEGFSQINAPQASPREAWYVQGLAWLMKLFLRGSPFMNQFQRL